MRRVAQSVLLMACACKPAPPPADSPVPIPTPAPRQEVEPSAPAEVEPTAPAPSLELDTSLAGFVHEEQPDGLLIRVNTIEPFGPDADALAQGFVDVIPQIHRCYEQHPVAGRSWLSVEVGKNAPKSIQVRLGPGEVDPALDACASKAMQSLLVPSESSIALFTLEVFGEAADASALPPAEPGQRMEARYGAGCYRWIEEPPCPPRKRCEVDRWELCVCPE